MRPLNSYGFLLEDGERIEALLQSLQHGTPTGWLPYRILFRNFWFFHKEEFVWHHGRLFLGGQNAAGKSTVLSMAVPLLLDGNKSEERLNTFGGHGRNMAYYVTGSPTPDDTSEAAYFFPVRTSYMALEFKKGDRYLTFGQGLHHDRSADDKSVRSWGFVITDGRRIGREDFDLVKENLASVSKGELKKLLGEGGEVFDTNLEYKRAVNRHLFGFKDLHDFNALIDLLLQIRRPKLSREIRPRDVAEILTQSLPALDDGVMRVTADSLDHIDQTIQNIERMEVQIQAVTEIEKATQTVFRRMAEVEAARFTQAATQADRADVALTQHEAELAIAKTQLAAATVELQSCEQRLAELAAEENSLREADAYQAGEQLTGIQTKIEQQKARLEDLRAAIRKQHERLKQLRSDLRDKEEKWETERLAALENIGTTSEEAEDARWEAAAAWANTLRQRWTDLQLGQPMPDLAGQVPRSAAEEGAQDRLTAIEAVKAQLGHRDDANAAWKQAMAAQQQSHQRFMEAEGEASRLAALGDDGRRSAAEAVREWVTKAEALRLAEPVVDQIASDLHGYLHSPGGRPHGTLAPARTAMEMTLGDILTAMSEGRHRMRELVERLADLRVQRRRLDAALPEPARTPEQTQARRALAEAGIPFAPLYETLEFQADLQLQDAARLEQALTEMGLLDALIVTEADRPGVLMLFASLGLSERLLLPEAGEWLATPPLAALLRPDGGDAPGAAGAVRSVMPRGTTGTGSLDRTPPPAGTAVAKVIAATISPGGTWRHGLLEGVAAPVDGARFIGRAARERFRRAEISRLDAEIEAAEVERRQAEAAVAAHENLAVQVRQEWSELEHLPALDALLDACLKLELARVHAERERNLLQLAQVQTATARNALAQQEAALQDAYRSFPGATGLNREGLQQMATATRNVANEFKQIYEHARTLQLLQEALERIADQIATESGRLEEKEFEVDDVAVGVRDLEGRRRGLQQLLDSPDAQSLFRRLEAIRGEQESLMARHRESLETRAVASADVKRLEQDLPALKDRATETVAEAGNARNRFREAVGAYPSLQPHAEAITDERNARQVARTLLNRFEYRPNLADDIQTLENQDRGTLSKLFEERRQNLRNFYPEYLPAERTSRLVQFMVDGMSNTPHALLLHLQGQAEVMRTVLMRYEAELFERHLLQDVGREVRRCMLKARDWVADINARLAAHPLRNEERVILEWEPKRTEHELGGLIARHANLLWIEEADLTPAQRDTLKGTFQEEVRQIREQARRGEWRPDVFREKLGEVLDYRNWFRFRIFVRGAVGGRSEITDTVFNARSGSERALVLLLPLIAGLSVRYDAASPQAPRILALDEGFAGIDALNSRQLIRFLTSLNLTWVVSSEKPPALTEELPGASLYSMLREGTVVAVRPFFWDGQQLLDAEAELP